MKITYTNERGQSIEMGRAPFYVLEKTGFADVSNEINIINYAKADGRRFTNTRLSGRELSIVGEFIGGNNYQECRLELIQVFNPKLKGVITYDNGGVRRSIDVRPTSGVKIGPFFRATAPFSVEFISESSYWRDEYKQVVSIAEWQGGFFFPLFLPTFMGEKNSVLIAELVNSGDVEASMIVEFKANGTVENPSIFHIGKQQEFKIERTMTGGEVIRVNLGLGKKTAISYLNGAETSVFSQITSDSEFIKLDIGNNLIRYDADSGFGDLEVKFEFYNLFVGV